MPNFKVTFRGRIIMVSAASQTDAVMKARQMSRGTKMILINVRLMPGIIDRSRRIFRG